MNERNRRLYHLFAAGVLLLTLTGSALLWVLTMRIADAVPASALARQRDMAALLLDMQGLRMALERAAYAPADQGGRQDLHVALTITALRLRDNRDMYGEIDPADMRRTQEDLGRLLARLNALATAAPPADLAAQVPTVAAMLPRLRHHNDDIHQAAMVQASAQHQLLRNARWTLIAFLALFGAFGLLLVALLLRQQRTLADLQSREAQISAVEAARAELHEKVARIAAAAPGAIFQYMRRADGTKAFTFISDAIRSLAGCTPAAVMADAQVLLGALPTQDFKRLSAVLDQSARDATAWTEQFSIRHPERGPVWVEGHAIPEFLPDGSVRWHGHLVEITARRHAEEALRASEERFRLTLGAVRDGLWDWNVDTGDIAYDTRAYEMLGYAPDAFPMSFRRWQEMTHPADWGLILDRIQDGLESMRSFQVEYRLRRADGSYAWIECKGQVVAWHDDMPSRVLGTNSDISDRRSMEEALRRSNTDLEQFAYAVSHDLRQPLRMVHSYLQLLDRSIKGHLDARTREFMDFALDGSRRMEQMMVALLDYSRVSRTTDPMAPIDPRAAVDEALHYLAPAIAEAEADVTVDGDWPTITASRDELVRLLQNLIGNAVKYRAPGTAPKVTVSGAVDGQRWRVTVADNGIGFSRDQAGRLFQVFQRLHARGVYDGAGVGLALCRRIVEHHDGTIEAFSDGEGLGSRFVVHLPLRQATAG